MTLYLKYRPQTIEELDLTDVRETLKKLLSSKNIPHAFLFSGPKGTGKTSSARILAKAINCKKNKGKTIEPCNSCSSCISISKGQNMDVIEMDAASNRGIDEIRSLRESVSLAPSSLTKKVYIIDEVHMLTTEAANAFLKTLEEPPPHVVFILATTNPEKLPETIHSRLFNVNFEKASEDEVTRQLSRVIKGEKLEVEKPVLSMIAKSADGSFRDAVKILENLALNFKKISKEDASEFLFKEKMFNLDEFFSLLSKKDQKGLFAEIERVSASSSSIKLYMDLIIERLHSALLQKSGLTESESKTSLSKDEIIFLLSSFSEAKGKIVYSPIPQLPLELSISLFCAGETKETKEKKNAKEIGSEENVKKNEEMREERILEGKSVEGEVWQKILSQIKTKNSSIEALLRAAQPMSFDGKTLTLGVYYQFHKERLESGVNRRTLEDVVAAVFGSPVSVDCRLTQKPEREVAKMPEKETILTEPEESDIIKAAKEIFGSG